VGLDVMGLKAPAGGAGARVACHVPCSLEHGQGIARTPARLLGAAGFEVIASSAGEACCGSAGTYSLLQPEIADALGAARAAALEESGAEVIASANIGCQEHLAAFTEVPVVHAVELLDWATGGPRPRGLGSS
jgi:glycolate oxidase iron-sulfur subunit